MQYVDKLTRQKRVEEEVKMALKPYFNKGEISKEEYKDIMRKAVPKVSRLYYLYIYIIM